MKRLALALLILTTLAIAQEHPSVTAQPNSIYAGADSKFEAAPDTAVITFSLSPQDDTAKGAYDKAAQAMEQVRAALRANGVDPKDAELGFFSVQPMYDWKNPKHKVIAYRVNTNVTVKLRQKDFGKIGPLTAQLADIDTASGQNLNYILDDMEAAKKKAVEDALNKARNSANAAATAGGRAIGELVYATVDVNEPVIIQPRMVMMAAKAEAGATPAPTEGFGAQKITVTAHVNALFAMK